jgi:zinc protease
VQTKNESAAEVVQLLNAEIDRVMQTPVAADELAARKATLIGGFSRSVETTAGLASAIRALVVTDRPPAELNARIDALQAVSADDVQRYAAAHLGVAGRRVAVAGVAERFSTALKAEAPALIVIPQDKLDLEGSAGLERQ